MAFCSIYLAETRDRRHVSPTATCFALTLRPVALDERRLEGIISNANGKSGGGPEARTGEIFFERLVWPHGAESETRSPTTAQRPPSIEGPYTTLF